MSKVPDFPTYFEALWGYAPFPWQSRLARDLETDGWPAWVTLPTGVGKTATIDIAIYHLARQASLPLAERHAPARIVFAVNRRIVVDEAYQRAHDIAAKLRSAATDPADPLHPIAAALRELSQLPDDDPLKAYPLRGGTFTDHSWAKTPTQPLVLTTTLDQLGSRLLFRGYGVSEGARPIHAALLANDSLLILDEAHTSRAFSQTLESIATLRARATEKIATPFYAVQLTATPPPSAEKRFVLDADDLTNPVIKRRLAASKPTILKEIPKAKGAARHSKIATEISPHAIELVKTNRRLLIVVNRVATAQALFAKLHKDRKQHHADILLLTGRIRPLDRDRLIDSLVKKHQLKSTDPSAQVPPLILIATQTIEVGADYDFDALITELAPLDSLRQRFGRLNRQGRDIAAPALIFAPEEALDAKKPDPIYSTCLPTVWEWLGKHLDDDANIDFGIDAFGKIAPNGEVLASLLAPAPDAPVLLPAHLDLLCQTSPEPHVSPEPALYIHGPGRDFPQISVILRADLTDETQARALLEATPPLATEAATLPLPFVRAWLENPDKPKDESGDAPGETSAEAKKPALLDVKEAWIWRNQELLALKTPDSLRPGDFLVVNAGLAIEKIQHLLHLPEGTSPLDQFEAAHLLSRDRLCIRLHRSAIAALKSRLPEGQTQQDFSQLLAPLLEADDEGEPPSFSERAWQKIIPELSRQLAAQLPNADPEKEIWQLAADISKKSKHGIKEWRITPLSEPEPGGVIITNRSRLGHTPWPLEPTNLGRQTLNSSEQVPLQAHSDAVAKRAEHNASGLVKALQNTLREAGKWHDLGKLDPRFQALLHGCSLAALGQRPELAKSGDARNRPLARHLRQLAELPDGFRHELLSTLIAEASTSLAEHPERELLLHLIASHHGRCRAMAPIIDDPLPLAFDITTPGGETIRYPGEDAPLARIDSGVTDRVWSLTRRFGWWGLPYLESLLRLADQCESANPSTPKP